MREYGIAVTPVVSRREVEEFVAVPFDLRRGDPNWVPPLVSQQRAFLDPRRNPFFEHADVALWLASRGGRIVGRTSSHVDHLHNRTHGENVAMFGFLEAEDSEVAAALLSRAREWSEARRATALRGPMSFSLHHECGVLVEGFAEPPMILTPYTPPSYAGFLVENGFVKAMDLLCFQLRLREADGDPARLLPKLVHVARKVARRGRVTVRRANPRRYHEEMARGFEVFNRAWADNWGFVPVTDAERVFFAKELHPIFDPRLCFIAEDAGVPVGFAACVADANQVLAHLGGHLFPGGWLKALRLKRRVTRARFLLFGVVAEYRGRGIDAMLVSEVLKGALATAYETLELSWILESNRALLRLVCEPGGALGPTLQRRYRIYEARL